MDQDTLNSDHDVIQSSGQFVNSAATTQSSASSVPASILPLSSLLEGLSIFEEATIPSETFTERIDSTKTIKNDNGDTILIQETTLIAETGEVIQEITTTETHQIVTLKPVEIEVEEVELRLQETVMEEGDIDLVSLSNEIATNTGISALELANDGLTTEEVIMFAKAIEVNTTLEKLDIEGNDITEEGLLALCSAIRLNKSLREINIGTQQIIVSDEVEMELASAIEKNENNAAALVAQNAIIRNKAAYELWLHRKRTKTIFVPETTEVTTVKKDRRILKNSRSGDNFANFDNADEDSEISESESVYDHSIPRDLTISDESFVKDERIGFVENEYFANEKSTSERNLKTAFDNEKNSLGDAKPINFQEGSLADLVPPIEFGIVDTETASSSKELISTTNDILIKEITISQEPPKFLSNDEPMFASDGSAVEEPIIIESGSIFDVDEIPAERQTLIGLPSKEFLHDNNAPVIPSETSTEEPTVVESVLTSLSNLPEESTGIKLVVASAMEGEPTDKFIDASSNSETESEEIQVSSIRVSVVTISSTEEPTIVESAPLLIVETLQTEEPTIIIEKSVNKSNISRNNILAEPIIGSSEDDVVEEIPMSTIVETKIKTELKTSLSNLDLPNLAKNNGDTLSVHETTIFSEAGEEIKEIVTIETHQVVSTKPIQVEVEETVREVRETLLEGGDLDLVWLANEVASNADMTSLELINDGLTTEEIIIFTKALEINTVLEKINISGNEINYKGLLAICRVIRVNKTLREIIIGVQQIVINDDVELEIASAIESNEYIITFDYKFRNSIAALRVQTALLKNQAAYEVWLHRKKTKTVYVTETTEVTTVKKDRHHIKRFHHNYPGEDGDNAYSTTGNEDDGENEDYVEDYLKEEIQTDFELLPQTEGIPSIELFESLNIITRIPSDEELEEISSAHPSEFEDATTVIIQTLAEETAIFTNSKTSSAFPTFEFAAVEEPSAKEIPLEINKLDVESVSVKRTDEPSLTHIMVTDNYNDTIEEIPVSTIVETRVKTKLRTSISDLDPFISVKDNGDTVSVHETTVLTDNGDEIKEIVTIETHDIVSTKSVDIEIEETVQEVRETVLEGGDLDLVWLANEVANNAEMTSLELPNNGLTTEEIIIFAKALEINTILEEIDFSGNDITEEGILALCRVIRINKTLRKIIIGVQSIVINRELELELVAAVESNEYITIFEYKFHNFASSLRVQTALARNKLAYEEWLHLKKIKTIYVTETTEITTVKKDRRLIKRLQDVNGIASVEESEETDILEHETEDVINSQQSTSENILFDSTAKLNQVSELANFNTPTKTEEIFESKEIIVTPFGKEEIEQILPCNEFSKSLEQCTPNTPSNLNKIIEPKYSSDKVLEDMAVETTEPVDISEIIEPLSFSEVTEKAPTHIDKEETIYHEISIKTDAIESDSPSKDISIENSKSFTSQEIIIPSLLSDEALIIDSDVKNNSPKAVATLALSWPDEFESESKDTLFKSVDEFIELKQTYIQDFEIEIESDSLSEEIKVPVVFEVENFIRNGVSSTNEFLQNILVETAESVNIKRSSFNEKSFERLFEKNNDNEAATSIDNVIQQVIPRNLESTELAYVESELLNKGSQTSVNFGFEDTTPTNIVTENATPLDVKEIIEPSSSYEEILQQGFPINTSNSVDISMDPPNGHSQEFCFKTAKQIEENTIRSQLSNEGVLNQLDSDNGDKTNIKNLEKELPTYTNTDLQFFDTLNALSIVNVIVMEESEAKDDSGEDVSVLLRQRKHNHAVVGDFMDSERSYSIAKTESKQTNLITIAQNDTKSVYSEEERSTDFPPQTNIGIDQITAFDVLETVAVPENLDKDISTIESKEVDAETIIENDIINHEVFDLETSKRGSRTFIGHFKDFEKEKIDIMVSKQTFKATTTIENEHAIELATSAAKESPVDILSKLVFERIFAVDSGINQEAGEPFINQTVPVIALENLSAVDNLNEVDKVKNHLMETEEVDVGSVLPVLKIQESEATSLEVFELQKPRHASRAIVGYIVDSEKTNTDGAVSEQSVESITAVENQSPTDSVPSEIFDVIDSQKITEEILNGDFPADLKVGENNLSDLQKRNHRSHVVFGYHADSEKAKAKDTNSQQIIKSATVYEVTERANFEACEKEENAVDATEKEITDLVADQKISVDIAEEVLEVTLVKVEEVKGAELVEEFGADKNIEQNIQEVNTNERIVPNIETVVCESIALNIGTSEQVAIIEEGAKSRKDLRTSETDTKLVEDAVTAEIMISRDIVFPDNAEEILTRDLKAENIRPNERELSKKLAISIEKSTEISVSDEIVPETSDIFEKEVKTIDVSLVTNDCGIDNEKQALIKTVKLVEKKSLSFKKVFIFLAFVLFIAVVVLTIFSPRKFDQKLNPKLNVENINQKNSILVESVNVTVEEVEIDSGITHSKDILLEKTVLLHQELETLLNISRSSTVVSEQANALNEELDQLLVQVGLMIAGVSCSCNDVIIWSDSASISAPTLSHVLVLVEKKAPSAKIVVVENANDFDTAAQKIEVMSEAVIVCLGNTDCVNSLVFTESPVLVSDKNSFFIRTQKLESEATVLAVEGLEAFEDSKFVEAFKNATCKDSSPGTNSKKSISKTKQKDCVCE